MSDRISNYYACLNVIYTYIRAQTAKGLVFEARVNAVDALQVVYETHWGTHQEVILPEINCLAAQAGLEVSTDVSREVDCQCLEKTSYVRVSLQLDYPVEELKRLRVTL